MKQLVIIMIVFIAFALLNCNSNDTAASKGYNAVIYKVVDGDTVKVEFDSWIDVPVDCSLEETVRLIGVNTPELFKEVPDYYAQEACDYTNQYYKAQVKVAFDDVSALRDKYGRLLAYIYVVNAKHKLLNEELIRNGYGIYYDAFEFNSGFMRRFEAAQTYAKKHSLGLWQ